MKRLICGLVMAVAGVAMFAPAAQGAPKLTMNEARFAVIELSYQSKGVYFFASELPDCTRRAKNRIRCSVRLESDGLSKPRICRALVKVVEHAEIQTRTLRRKCRTLDVKALTFEQARAAAAKAMDPKAMHPNYEMGYGGSSTGRNRFSFEATWVTEKDQICVQQAKVRLVKQKVLVNVSEIACVDQAEWPRATGSLRSKFRATPRVMPTIATRIAIASHAKPQSLATWARRSTST